jgi:hypothetical protein
MQVDASSAVISIIDGIRQLGMDCEIAAQCDISVDDESSFHQKLSEQLGVAPNASVNIDAPHCVWVRSPAPLSDKERATITGYDDKSVLEQLLRRKTMVILVGDDSTERVFRFAEEQQSVSYRYWEKYETVSEIQGSISRCHWFEYRVRDGYSVSYLGKHEDLGCTQLDIGGSASPKGIWYGDFKSLHEHASALIQEDPKFLLTEQNEQKPPNAANPVLRIDHIGIVSKYRKKMKRLLDALGSELLYGGIVNDIGVRCEYYSMSNMEIELVDPVRDDSIVSSHRSQMPFYPLHHIAFEVRSLTEGVEFFKSKGYHPVDGRILLAPKPYHRVIFLSPLQTAGLLVELVADDGKDYSVYGGTKNNKWSE